MNSTTAPSGVEDPVCFVETHRDGFGDLLNVFGQIWTSRPSIQTEWMAENVAGKEQVYLKLKYDLFPERVDRIRRALEGMKLLDTINSSSEKDQPPFTPALNQAINILRRAYP